MSLSQNYPNPFNPTTKIGYTIPAEMKTGKLPGAKQVPNVKLVVIDILGREVATLVNKYMPPGKYEIILNTQNLSSGIYFYKLSFCNLTEIKKMILLK